MARPASQSEQTSQTRPTDVLIRPKLYIPQVRPNLVPRPRLLARLNEALVRPLTIVVAPPGFGKTTLLSEWIASARSALPVAWISLDEHDNDPLRFGTYLVAALATLEIGIGEDAWLETEAPRPLSLEARLTALINHIAEVPADFVLVLDDYHLITLPEIHQALAFLVAHLPPPMRLVVASRADPSGLPLAQLRARGQLVELHANDLRFAPAEAAAFLNQQMDLNLPAEAIAALAARTEGWIAGLQLAALSMRERADRAEFIQAFTGSHRYILDYLAEQVLQRQPPEVQAFLLETSILDRLSGPLCDAVLGKEEGGKKQAETGLPFLLQSSALILEQLERANLFLIPLDDHRHWYRYHTLFSDFLRERLRQTWPERWPELHRRAAEWCERHGLIPEAVGHALAVGDTGPAARLVEQIAESIWMRGEMIRLLGWLEALPDEMICSRPRLCIFHAWILNILGRYEAAQERLNDAERGLKAGGGIAVEERPVIRGMLATVQAIMVMMEGDAGRTQELSQQALRDLPEANWVWRSVVTRNLGNAYLLTGQTAAAYQALTEALSMSQQADNIYMTMVAMYELGELDILCGRLHQAAQIFREALQLAAARGTPGLAMPGALHVGLSEVLREWNDLEAGTREALAGIEYGHQGRSLGVQVCGYTRLGMLAQAHGDAEGAARAFRQAIQLAPTRRMTSFMAHHDAQARLWQRQGDAAAALRWIQAYGLSAEDEPSYLDEAAYLTLARALLAQNRADEAIRLLTRLRAAAEAAGRGGRLIEIFALLAVGRQAQGKTGEAFEALRQALTLAEPEGYIRVFVDEGQAMRLLLERMRDEGGRMKEYVRKLLAAFVKDEERAAKMRHESISVPHPSAFSLQPLPDPLSARELEILHLVAAGLSNQEIAQRLVVALSTIQWHLKNLYGKLNVHSRTQAVARARELDLLA